MAARGTCLSFAAGSRHAFTLRGGTSQVFRRSSWAQAATTPNTQGERSSMLWRHVRTCLQWYGRAQNRWHRRKYPESTEGISLHIMDEF